VAPEEPDEVHLNTDKVAVIQRERPALGGVGSLFFTGVQTFFPKVLVNVELGDYAKLSQRDCRCPLQQIGLSTHLSGIRSYAKLTSEGVTVLGGDLIRLLEEVLPEKFGGRVGDYQLAEEEEDGTTRVSVIVSPSVDSIDEAAVISAVLEALSEEVFGDRSRTAELWRQARVLRVVRREPLYTGRAKVLPLHLLGSTRLKSG
jgi:hypothetical protein